MNYTIINISEVDKINWEELNENSMQTARKSLNEEFILISWNDIEPTFINNLQSKSSIYTDANIYDILNTDEWRKKLEI
jgi:hypothetical protein